MAKILSKVTQSAILASFLLLSVSSAASVKTSELEINFSEYLDKRMERISAIDRGREKVFRKYRRDGSRRSLRPRDVLNKSRFFQTEWANERLIPDLAEYSVPSLLTEMMKRGIEGANPDGFDGRVVLEVDKMYVSRFPLAAINSFNTRMEGKVKLFDNQGDLVAEYDLWTGLVPKFTASRNYKGPDYAYLSTSGATRVGPIAAEFVAEALEKVFPNYDAPDLIFLEPGGISG
jgi:hypothetical protein